jgi:hypothetical protein
MTIAVSRVSKAKRATHSAGRGAKHLLICSTGKSGWRQPVFLTASTSMA